MAELLGHALSPAKINHGLAVLGKREDGFHEIRSEMLSITLFDRISMFADGTGTVRSNAPGLEPENNIMLRASRELAARTGRTLDVDFTLEKRIPMAAGLGGGSSNAGSVLRLLCAHWSLNINDPDVQAAAAETGSDVPFFLRGGPALVTGRGEAIEQLPDRPAQWLVIAHPDLVIEQKTASLFQALGPGDYTPTTAVDDHDERGARKNAFTRAIYTLHPDLRNVRERFEALADSPVQLSGAGPAHYAFCADLQSATSLLRRASRDLGPASCSFYLARTMNGPGPLDMKRNGGQ